MFDYGPFSLNSLCINLQISLVLINVTPPKQTLLRVLEATISTRGFLEVVLFNIRESGFLTTFTTSLNNRVPIPIISAGLRELASLPLFDSQGAQHL